MIRGKVSTYLAILHNLMQLHPRGDGESNDVMLNIIFVLFFFECPVITFWPQQLEKAVVLALYMLKVQPRKIVEPLETFLPLRTSIWKRERRRIERLGGEQTQNSGLSCVSGVATIMVQRCCLFPN